MTARPAIQLSALTVQYGNFTAIKELTLELNQGVIGLLGPNGAGKSSLLRVLATAQQPSSGQIHGCGLDFLSPQSLRAARRLIGYLPQDPGFYPHFTVAEFLHHFALLNEIAD
ncbi:MAG: ATP-binding cassette domain-containing protein, partial [Angustibacter sp.]